MYAHHSYHCDHRRSSLFLAIATTKGLVFKEHTKQHSRKLGGQRANDGWDEGHESQSRRSKYCRCHYMRTKFWFWVISERRTRLTVRGYNGITSGKRDYESSIAQNSRKASIRYLGLFIFSCSSSAAPFKDASGGKYHINCKHFEPLTQKNAQIIPDFTQQCTQCYYSESLPKAPPNSTKKSHNSLSAKLDINLSNNDRTQEDHDLLVERTGQKWSRLE